MKNKRLEIRGTPENCIFLSSKWFILASTYIIGRDTMLDELGELAFVDVVIVLLQFAHVGGHVLAEDVVSVRLRVEFATLAVVARESLRPVTNAHSYKNQVNPRLLSFTIEVAVGSVYLSCNPSIPVTPNFLVQWSRVTTYPVHNVSTVIL